jgi:hypothetical protein
VVQIILLSHFLNRLEEFTPANYSTGKDLDSPVTTPETDPSKPAKPKNSSPAAPAPVPVPGVLGKFMNNRYMNIVKEGPQEIVLSSPMVQEIILLIALFLFSFVAVVVNGFQVWSFCFPAAVGLMIYFNLPKQEVWRFVRKDNEISKEYLFLGRVVRRNVYQLNLLSQFKVEENKEKPGSFRVVLCFASGERIPLTDCYYYSFAAKEQSELINTLNCILKTE